MAGVMCAVVGRTSSNQRRRPPGSKIALCSGIIRQAPSESGVKTSRSSGSCDSPDSMVNRSLAPSSNLAACHVTKFTSGLWPTATHFGTPVLPEVNSR